MSKHETPPPDPREQKEFLQAHVTDPYRFITGGILAHLTGTPHPLAFSGNDLLLYERFLEQTATATSLPDAEKQRIHRVVTTALQNRGIVLPTRSGTRDYPSAAGHANPFDHDDTNLAPVRTYLAHTVPQTASLRVIGSQTSTNPYQMPEYYPDSTSLYMPYNWRLTTAIARMMDLFDMPRIAQAAGIPEKRINDQLLLRFQYLHEVGHFVHQKTQLKDFYAGQSEYFVVQSKGPTPESLQRVTSQQALDLLRSYHKTHTRHTHLEQVADTFAYQHLAMLQ